MSRIVYTWSLHQRRWISRAVYTRQLHQRRRSSRISEQHNRLELWSLVYCCNTPTHQNHTHKSSGLMNRLPLRYFESSKQIGMWVSRNFESLYPHVMSIMFQYTRTFYLLYHHISKIGCLNTDVYCQIISHKEHTII